MNGQIIRKIITNIKDNDKNKIIFLSSILITIIIAIIIAISCKNAKTNSDTTNATSLLEQNGAEELVIAVDDPSNAKVQNIKEVDEKTQYHIKVNYKANTVTIYKKDNNNNLKPVKAMICSTGESTPTSGIYKTSDRFVWAKLVGNVYGRYCTRITGSILFHSVPYTEKNNGALEYWEYDKLGTTASKGCVRLTLQDAKWIYNNIPQQTTVEFYADSNPGPLGKPTIDKITWNETCRGWDPTDTDSNNPWLTYVATSNNSNNSNSPNNLNNAQTNKNNENKNSLSSNTNTNSTTNNTVNNTNKDNSSTNEENNTHSENTNNTPQTPTEEPKEEPKEENQEPEITEEDVNTQNPQENIQI